MRNISRSGLLFTAQQAHSVATSIELTFPLPKVMRDEPPATVRCQGPVVRCVLAPPNEGLPVIAIKILDYEFMRTSTPPPVRTT